MNPAPKPEATQAMAGSAPATKRALARSVLALVLLCVVGGICISLGLWQLDRAAQRDTLHQLIEDGRRQAPLALSASTPHADFIPWRAAMAQGHWSEAHTVLLENRNLDGRPGYWVATPLLLSAPPLPSKRNDAVSAGSAEISAVTGRPDSDEFLGRGAAQADAAVLVLRGWLPRDLAASGQPDIPVEPGLLEVRGELHAHVPRIFELWQWAGGTKSQLPGRLPAGNGAVIQVQNLSLEEYARATGLRLLPVVLAQTQASTGMEVGGPQHGNVLPQARQAGDSTAALQDLRREWPGPSLDSDQNRGYALQWFGFSAIALIAALFVLRGMFRRNTPEASSKETP